MRIFFDNQLDFIDQHHRQIKMLAENIKETLPNIKGGGKNRSLEALGDKIHHMIVYKGNSDSVKPMLVRMINKGVKKLSQPEEGDHLGYYSNMMSKGYGAKFLGYGHFRWNRKAIELTDAEINRVKEFFDL